MSTTLAYIRAYIGRIVVVVCCLGILAGYYFTSPTVGGVSDELYTWNMCISSFTLFVGLITIFSRYGRSIINRDTNWPFHLYCLVLIIIWIPFGFHYGIYADLYQTAYLSTKITLHIAILGLLIFFMTSALYRTFRIRSLRTAVLTFLAVVMIFLNAPYLRSYFPTAGDIAYWLLNNPQMSGARAMVLCGGIGGIILGIRILLGHEKGALRVTGGM